MHSNLSAQSRKIFLASMLVGIILILYSIGIGSPVAYAQKANTPQPDKYYSVNPITLSDGTLLKEHNINGPSAPQPGFEVERQAVALSTANATIINGVPAYGSVLGCSGVAGGITAAYYDRSGYPNIYTGPTNGGVMPLNGSPWPPWSDGFDTWYSNPLIASRNGLDGRTIPGTLDDYWYRDGFLTPEPYIRDGRAQHVWGDAIGDFMRTSQYAVNNADGITKFYTYDTSPGAIPTSYNSASLADPLTCDVMASNSLPDGTLGMKRFYEARGYAVGACYNQPTDNMIAGGFSFAQFKAEIDAGRPVMLGLEGHNVVGIGYDASSNLIYIHDGFDYGTHTMPWGGSYVGMRLLMANIVNLVRPSTGNHAVSDFDGDGDTDVAVFRPSNGVWYVKDQFGVQFGANGDIPVPRDYNGDGLTDVAVFRRSNGVWYVKDQFGVQFGANGDIPVPGDYNGDGLTDVAVFRPSNGVWYVKDQFGVQFGANGDIPAPSRR